MKDELTELPDRFKIVEKNNRYYVTTQLKEELVDFDNVNLIVDEWASDNNLRLLGCGVSLSTNIRDWEFKRRE